MLLYKNGLFYPVVSQEEGAPKASVAFGIPEGMCLDADPGIYSPYGLSMYVMEDDIYISVCVIQDHTDDVDDEEGYRLAGEKPPKSEHIPIKVGDLAGFSITNHLPHETTYTVILYLSEYKFIVSDGYPVDCVEVFALSENPDVNLAENASVQAVLKNVSLEMSEK